MRRETIVVLQKLVAECIGTGILVLVGAGAVAASFTLTSTGRGPLTMADLGFIGLAFAIAVTTAIYSMGWISGQHINPAITIALWATRRINTGLAIGYIFAQLVGGFIGALLIAVWYGTPIATNGLNGITTFGHGTSGVQAAATEAIITFLLMLAVMGTAVDKRAPAGWAGLIIGLIIGGNIIAAGPVTGGSMNPARTFGPYLVTTIFGGPNFWAGFWVYLFGPAVGAIAAAFTYDFLAMTSPWMATRQARARRHAPRQEAPPEQGAPA